MNSNTGDVQGGLVQAGRVDQLLLQFGGGARPPRPDMLPLDPAFIGFANRTAELDALDRHLDEADEAGRPLIAVLSGMPGVGKTMTALRWAHRVKDRFPDGVLVGEIGGSDRPRTPAEVLGTFLPQLGLADVPAGEQERVAAFRNLTTSRRMLVVLDDAATSAQVLALLPSSAASAVLVTSRRELPFLGGGVVPLPLAPFEEDAALRLLSAAVSEPDAEPALRKLSAACGRLPMALQIAAAGLRGRSSISSYVDRVVADLLDRLEVDGERLLRAQFESAYRDLPDELRRAYRLLGLHPGAEFSPAAAAALLDQPEPVAEETLLALTRANLLMPAKSGRHRFHALLRQHARAKALEEDPAAHREDALRRIVRHYHDFVMARDVVLSKRRRLSDRYADVVPAHRGEDAHARALADLDAERATLTEVVRVAAEAGMHDRVWQLCESLFPYHVDRDHYEDVLAVQPLGVAAAERAGDDRALVRMHSQHGSAYFIAHEYDTAQEHFERSAALADRIGDALGRQSAVEWSGLIHERRGEFDAALECFEKSREIVETRFEPDRRERPRGLYRMHSGRVLTAAGRGDEAIPRLREAFDFFVGLGERANPAKIALSLAQAHLQVGDVPEAAGWAQRALGLCREVRSAADTAAVLEVLAEIATRQGDADGAARHRREAGEILALLGDDRARALLGRHADS